MSFKRIGPHTTMMPVTGAQTKQVIAELQSWMEHFGFSGILFKSFKVDGVQCIVMRQWKRASTNMFYSFPLAIQQCWTLLSLQCRGRVKLSHAQNSASNKQVQLLVGQWFFHLLTFNLWCNKNLFYYSIENVANLCHYVYV